MPVRAGSRCTGVRLICCRMQSIVQLSQTLSANQISKPFFSIKAIYLSELRRLMHRLQEKDLFTNGKKNVQLDKDMTPADKPKQQKWPSLRTEKPCCWPTRPNAEHLPYVGYSLTQYNVQLSWCFSWIVWETLNCVIESKGCSGSSVQKSMALL